MRKQEFIVIGKGGREHCLATLLAENARLYSIGGSDGIRKIAAPLDETPVPLDLPIPEEMLQKLQELPKAVVVIGPEQPLAAGWVDQILEFDPTIQVLGPSQKAAQLESSKWWCKKFMQKYGVPTAHAAEVTSPEQFFYIQKEFGDKFVVKADGLAAGKGVAIFEEAESAGAFVQEILEQKRFGAQNKCLIEEFLEGEELSLFLLLDGESAVELGIAKDYKRLEDNDEGPNTGGMGSYSPLPDVSEKDREILQKTVVQPFLEGLRKENIFYRGFLYFGLIRTEKGFHVLEINVRMGDPETQVVLPLIKAHLPNLFFGASKGKLKENLENTDLIQVDSNYWRIQPEKFAVCVILASRGYPLKYKKGIELPNLKKWEGNSNSQYLFHAGTKETEKGWATAGGRVLNVVSIDKNIESAREKCYEIVNKLDLAELYYRKDIASSE